MRRPIHLALPRFWADSGINKDTGHIRKFGAMEHVWKLATESSKKGDETQQEHLGNERLERERSRTQKELSRAGNNLLTCSFEGHVRSRCNSRLDSHTRCPALRSLKLNTVSRISLFPLLSFSFLFFSFSFGAPWGASPQLHYHYGTYRQKALGPGGAGGVSRPRPGEKDTADGGRAMPY